MSEENLQANNEEQPQEPQITEEQIAEMLRTEPRFQAYFEGFRSYSVDSFITSYASKKKLWLDYGQGDIERNARAETHWIETAAEHLTYILQKKLFDAQCLWRAEQATYEGVEICYDFEAWEQDVLNCPFLEPITEDELECYRQFLMSNNADPEELRHEEWQDYEEIKEAYNTNNANRNFPEWYDFHNGRTGAGVYMTLPNTRGEKEKFYMDLARKKLQEEKAEEWAEQERTRDKRPTISAYDQEQLRYFVNTFEDKRTRELYEAFTYSSRHSEESSDLHTIVDFLLNADEAVPIERHYDFREALREAARRYELRRIADHLPLAYEEYLLNLSVGLRGATENSRFDFKAMDAEIAGNYRRRILEGRKLAGEPEDFDF